MPVRILNIDSISALSHPAAVTVGMFDGVHAGHRHLLHLLRREAAAQSLTPIAVTFDRHPRYVLGADAGSLHLLSTYDERMELLARCGIGEVAVVHFTKQLAALSACQFVKQYLLPKLNMKALVLGYDNVFGNKAANDFDQLPQLAQKEGFGIFCDTAVYLDGVEVSSTKIRHALAAGDVAHAARMLGEPYSLSGNVIHGRQVGRTLGFPTANVAVEEGTKVIPKEGVYAVRAWLRGGEPPPPPETADAMPRHALPPAPQPMWTGMASLGPQPTFGETRATLEVNLFDCHEDLYDKELHVCFLSRLRDIIQFATADDLARQLAEDRQQVLTLREIS